MGKPNAKYRGTILNDLEILANCLNKTNFAYYSTENVINNR